MTEKHASPTTNDIQIGLKNFHKFLFVMKNLSHMAGSKYHPNKKFQIKKKYMEILTKTTRRTIIHKFILTINCKWKLSIDQ